MVTLTTAATLLLLAASAPAAPEELSLPDALAELERANPTLGQARSRAEEAHGVVRQSWAALLPTLTAQGSYLRNSDEAVLELPPALGGRTVNIQPLDSLTLQGTARVPLVAPTAWFDTAAAKGSARAQDASLEAARKNLRAAFTQAAHASRAAEELVTASESAVQSALELERSASRKVEAGTAAPLDRLRAETERTRRESDLAQARANLEKSRLALGVLLGRERPVRVLVPEVTPAQPLAADVLAPAALAARPEVAVQRAQVEAAEAGVKSAWARLAPNVSASAAYFVSDVAYVTGEKDGWRATLDLTWPLYDGGFRYGKRQQARAQLSSAQAGQEAQRLAVLQEVQDATRDVAVAGERLRLAESQRHLASDAAATARRGFEAGVSSSLDVIDANDRLYAAEVGLADARARVAQAAVALDRAAGR